MPEKSVKVLLVTSDDTVSRFFSMLLRDTKYSLIRPAENMSAPDEVKRSSPAIVLLDVDETPGARLMDLCLILAEYPRPVLLVTRNTEGARRTVVKGLNIGAVDILNVPDGAPSLTPEQRERLMKTLNTGASLRVSPIAFDDAVAVVESVPRGAGRVASGGAGDELCGSRRFDVVGVAISTGGPNALSRLVPSLPADFPVPMLVVQHIIPGFIEGIIKRLDQICEVHVKLAEQGEPLIPGTVYFAPDKFHLTIRNSAGRLHARLSSEPADLLFCPSADVLFASMAEVCGPRGLAVIMTGMGHDGVEGIRLIKKAGGTTVAQDRQSSVIYGMARVAVDAKLIDRVVPLHDMAGEVYRLLSAGKMRQSNEIVSS